MEEGIGKKLREFWDWLWNSESWLSYIVFLVLIFIFIKLIFFPLLSLIFGTSLPLAIVESSSMDHHSLNLNGQYMLCDKTFSQEKSFNLDEYWTACGLWYEKNFNITKEQFSSFKLKNGFRKGDIMIIIGKNTDKIKIGDVLIFQSAQATPIIHRIVSLNPIQTKGDHNPEQIGIRPDPRGIDETNIKSNQIIGVAVARIPYVGWIKIGVINLINKIF